MDLQTFRDSVQESRRRAIALRLNATDKTVTSELAFAELDTAHEELRASEEELRSQNEELLQTQSVLEHLRAADRDLFDQSPDPLLITDAEGLVQDANHAMLDLVEIERGPFKGKPFVAFLPLRERATFRRRLTGIARRSGTASWRLTLVVGGKREIPLGVRARTGVHPFGGSTIIRWSLRDLSADAAPDPELTQLTTENLALKAESARLRDQLAGRDAAKSGHAVHPAADLEADHFLVLSIVERGSIPVNDLLALCHQVRTPRRGEDPLLCESTIVELLSRGLMEIGTENRIRITKAGRARLGEEGAGRSTA